jgi:hypothetical protein
MRKRGWGSAYGADRARMPRRPPAIANPTSSTALRNNNQLLHLVRSGSPGIRPTFADSRGRTTAGLVAPSRPQYARTDVESGRALEGGRFRVPTGRVVRARRGGGTGGLRRLCRRDHRANADRGDHASVVQTASVRASRLSTRHVDGGGCSEPGCPGAWIAIRWWIARIHGCGALPTRTRESASAPSGHAGMGADQAGVVLHVRRAGSPFCASDDESERRARCPQDGASGSLDAARAAALADAGVAARSTEPLSESNAALAALL